VGRKHVIVADPEERRKRTGFIRRTPKDAGAAFACGDEHEPAGVRAQMRAQQLDQERGQRDGARGLGRLRRRQLHPAAGFDHRSSAGR
jgi:hypothetical protein